MPTHYSNNNLFGKTNAFGVIKTHAKSMAQYLKWSRDIPWVSFYTQTHYTKNRCKRQPVCRKSCLETCLLETCLKSCQLTGSRVWHILWLVCVLSGISPKSEKIFSDLDIFRLGYFHFQCVWKHLNRLSQSILSTGLLASDSSRVI